MVTKEEIIEVLKNTIDPELGIDLYTLGLIYDVDMDELNQKLVIKMTLTSPFCPYGLKMVDEIKNKIRVLGLDDVKVDVVFDPPWKPSDEVRAMLGV